MIPATPTSGLYAELLGLTRSGWRSRFEMDDVGRWWLIEDGRRRKNSWRPKDEVDMLVGVALLYMLVDQAAQFSIPTKYAQAVEANGQSVTAFREQLMISAFNQYRKLRY